MGGEDDNFLWNLIFNKVRWQLCEEPWHGEGDNFFGTLCHCLLEVRKSKKLSQEDIGKLVGAHGAVIGRYERDEVKPSIEMATHLAEALQVSLDYLVGATDTLLETNILNRILDIQKLLDHDKQHVFALLDAFLKQTKLQAIL